MKLRYTIEDGIPLLLPPELLQAAKAAGSDEHDAAEHDAVERYPVEYYQAGHDPPPAQPPLPDHPHHTSDARRFKAVASIGQS